MEFIIACVAVAYAVGLTIVCIVQCAKVDRLIKENTKLRRQKRYLNKEIRAYKMRLNAELDRKEELALRN